MGRTVSVPLPVPEPSQLHDREGILEETLVAVLLLLRILSGVRNRGVRGARRLHGSMLRDRGGSCGEEQQQRDDWHRRDLRDDLPPRKAEAMSIQGVMTSTPARFASVLNAVRSLASISCRRSVWTFNSAMRSFKIGYAAAIGFPSPRVTTPSSDARRLLILIGKFSGSWLL